MKLSAPAPRVPPALGKVIDVGARMNRIVPEGVAVGGAICAVYAQHRLSIDIDFVLRNLSGEFDAVRDRLLDEPGWQEARVRRPHLILGSLDKVEIGFRQLRRRAPIETRLVQTEQGCLTIPTLEEMVRIKAFLAYERNYTRDLYDLAEMACCLARDSVVQALLSLDEKMGWERQPTVLLEVIKALVHCEPRDWETHGFQSFRFLEPRLKTWEEVKAICQDVGQLLAEKAIKGHGDAP
ncbi:MAG: hypothetical protein A2W31_07425 [Planctomycetes bacterium RBG_16_64_10]|nr:MAG: hypothetical protein A2W31_07425 [Planctomycetes bacterium RBG_16_64_10]